MSPSMRSSLTHFARSLLNIASSSHIVVPTRCVATTMLRGPPIATLNSIVSAAVADGDREMAIDPAIQSSAAEALVSEIKSVNLEGKPPMGLTENLAPTFLSSGNPCLDFFFHVVPDTPSDELIQRLQLAWNHDPLVTLKLVFNLRGVRGTGKSDKEGFYAAALWINQMHPRTLALNLKALVNFGYFKDLPEILYRILEGYDVRERAKEEIRKRRVRKWRRLRNKFKKFKNEGEKTSENSEEEEVISEEEEVGVLENLEELGTVLDKEGARKLRKEKEIAKARKALYRYANDANYRFLYDRVCDVFAEFLKLDMEYLSSGKLNKISLAAKWCPSIDSSYDKATLVCEGIATRVFPKECDKEYEGLEEAHYLFRTRDRLRKQVLVPLRKALDLPEVYMCANKWETLPYNRVASVAMKNYKTLFMEHDQERFDDYLKKVERGEAKIAAGAVLPHEIIKTLYDKDGEKVAELQWARMVDDLSKKGKLTNCIAVCDVSGSMSGTPMEVCVALGLLVSELSEEPWKGKVITFSHDPQVHMIKGETLKSKTEFISTMDWGFNTDFLKVFERMLEVAVEGKLREEQMVKRIFVFSDMEFDEAGGYHVKLFHEEDTDSENGSGVSKETCETNYEVIERKFKENGYNKVPEIVFWNLRNSSSTPVARFQKGVALVSGFSKNLLRLFLEGGGIVNPEDVMAIAISSEEYKKLVVYD